MSTIQDFSKVMADQSDIQLLDILASPDEYNPDAIKAAHEELRRRNLSSEKMSSLQVLAEQARSISEHALPWPMRGLAFLLALTTIPGIILVGFVQARYNKQGYARKSKELAIWFGFGFVFWIIAGFLVFRLLAW